MLIRIKFFLFFTFCSVFLYLVQVERHTDQHNHHINMAHYVYRQSSFACLEFRLTLNCKPHIRFSHPSPFVQCLGPQRRTETLLILF